VLTPAGPVAGGIGVMLLAAPEGSFACASAEFGGDVRAAAQTAADELRTAVAGQPVSAVYVTASPGSEEAVLRGVQDVFGGGVAVVGGSAADNDVTGSWSVLHDGQAFGDGVAMFAVAGSDVSAGAGLCSPYQPTARRVEVTAADGRTLLTLDGRPAADVLFELVGDAIGAAHRDGGMTLGPMSTRPYALQRGDDHLAVHVASINQPAGTVSLFAEAESGDHLVAMENQGGGGSAAAAGLAIRRAYAAAKESGGLSSPSAALLVYCGGLGIAVGDALEGNMRVDFGAIPGLPPAALGITAFGEQGPVGGGSQHCNLSVAMLLLE
jgi:hypothetical protein